MPLSPEQIVAEEFRLRARGYDRDEVDAFLDRLADQVEAAAARLRNAEQRVSALEAELAAVREREVTLTRTLATVQDAADRARADAEAEVAALRSTTERELTEARAQALQEAAGIRSEAEHEAAELRARLQEVQDVDAAHRDRLRGHLQGQLEALDALPDPYAELLHRAATADGAPDEGSGDVAGQPTVTTSEADTGEDAADGQPEPSAEAGLRPTAASPSEVPADEPPAAPDAADARDHDDGDRHDHGDAVEGENEERVDPWRRRTDGGGEEQRDGPVEPEPPMWG